MSAPRDPSRWTFGGPGPTAGQRPWLRLLIPIIGVIALAIWLALPAIRFMILERRYSSSQGAERDTILAEIASLGTHRAVPILVEAIRDPDHRERYQEILIGLLDERDLEMLLGQLEGEVPGERTIAAFALASVMDRPWMAEERALRLADTPLFSALIDGLSEGPSGYDFIEAIRFALARRPDSDAVTPLLDRLRSADAQDRRNAMRAAYFLHETRQFKESLELRGGVREALRDEDARVRVSAALFLEKEALEEDREPLLRAVHDPDASVREGVASALGRLGGEGVPEALLEMLEDRKDGVREAAALSLGRLRIERTIPHLIRMLRETGTMPVRHGGATIRMPDPFSAEAAAQALGNFSDPEVVEALIEVISEPDTHERVLGQAADSLGKIGDPKAIPPVATLLEDSRLSIRGRAISSLKEIGGGEAARALLERVRVVIGQDKLRGELDALGRALRSLSGLEYGPYPGDDEADAEAGIRAWEDWIESRDQ